MQFDSFNTSEHLVLTVLVSEHLDMLVSILDSYIGTHQLSTLWYFASIFILITKSIFLDHSSKSFLRMYQVQLS